MSASWFLVSTYLIWILGSKIDSVEQPIKSNSVGSGHMSHCWASSFVQLIFTLGRMRVGEHVVHIKYLINLLLSFVNWVLGFRIKNCPSFLVANMLGLNCRQFPVDSLIGLIVALKNFYVEPQSQCPRDREQKIHAYVVHGPENNFRLCGTVRDRSLFLAHPTHWDKCSASKNTQDTSWGWFWRSPAKSEPWNKPCLQCCAEYPTWQFDDSDSCDEPRKLALLVVCHMPESILWLLLQVWWLTIK